MVREVLKAAKISIDLKANVYCDDDRSQRTYGYYDDTARLFEQLTIFPGSCLPYLPNDQGWGHVNLERLEREGCVVKRGNLFEVIKPIMGSPSGTASIILGKNPGTAYGADGKWRELTTQKGIDKLKR